MFTGDQWVHAGRPIVMATLSIEGVWGQLWTVPHLPESEDAQSKVAQVTISANYRGQQPPQGGGLKPRVLGR